MSNQPAQYGTEDATFRAAGGETGIRQLVDDFYDIMGSGEEYRTIWSWHPPGNEISRDKLARFLCGWMGGPPRYNEKYGKINLPPAHAHLKVTAIERDQWLACMSQALHQQEYPDSLIEYLLEQLSIPAERIRVVCEKLIDNR
jgi:hemoglobin